MELRGEGRGTSGQAHAMENDRFSQIGHGHFSFRLYILSHLSVLSNEVLLLNFQCGSGEVIDNIVADINDMIFFLLPLVAEIFNGIA